ncbi:MAG TPA: hypothetical protein PKA06_02170, partial [Gemmatales bacterium]|nr:hypothetical protein [Gemmatales bacterium]
ALISEIAILGAMILPRIPIEPGRTWRGTFLAVSTVSLIIGGIGGYVAGQFGGRGGGGYQTSGPVRSATSPNVSLNSTPAPEPSKAAELSPVRPESYLAAQVDLYFTLDSATKLIAHHSCEIVAYRKQGFQWIPEFSQVAGKNLEEFLRLQEQTLTGIQKSIPEIDLGKRRLRIFLDPFPGEGVYDKLRQSAESLGWKVERKNMTWQPENPEP